MSRIANAAHDKKSVDLTEFLWLAATVAVPLGINPWGASAFELPKVALLRAIVLLMGLAWASRLIRSAGRARRNADCQSGILRYWPILLLAAVAAFATARSINPRLSLWGSTERHQGLVSLMTYLALFLLVAPHPAQTSTGR